MELLTAKVAKDGRKGRKENLRLFWEHFALEASGTAMHWSSCGSQMEVTEQVIENWWGYEWRSAAARASGTAFAFVLRGGVRGTAGQKADSSRLKAFGMTKH